MEYKGYFYIMSRQTGMVLDVCGGNRGACTPLIVYPKRSEGAENQLWKYNPNTCELVSRLNGYRVDVSGGHACDCAKIVNYPANNAPNQKWVFKPDGSIQSGLCGHGQWVLHVEGTSVILHQRKAGGPSINQQWDVVPYVPTTGFYIRSALNNCFLQIKDGSCGCAPLCIGNNPTRWKYNKENRTICSEQNNYAIDVEGGSAGSSVKVYHCHCGTNQQWTFEKNGSILSGLGSNLVLDVKESRGAGAPVILYAWFGTKNQQWYISED